jgi:hypothetical protein
MGYIFAHYLSYLVERGQQAVFALGDPWGRGRNLLGLAHLHVNYLLSLREKRISRRSPHGASGGLTDLGGHHVGVCVRDHVIAVDGDQLGAR